MASADTQTTDNEETEECKKCGQSNKLYPLVPSLIPGQDKLCPECKLKKLMEDFETVKDERVDNEVKEIQQEGVEMARSLENIPAENVEDKRVNNEVKEIQQEGDEMARSLENIPAENVEDKRVNNEVKEIQQEVKEMARSFGNKPADTEPPWLKETRQQARCAIKLMMRLQVPKQKDKTEEVGKLEPTSGDVKLMEALVPDLCFRLRKGSLRQFHSILYPENNRVDGKLELKGTLFDISDSQIINENLYKDQKTRANKLVEEMKGRKSKKVILLDGHGRTLLSIIHAMIEQGKKPDSCKFVVVDIDEECQSFHKHFFPVKVTCKHMNILDIELGGADMLYMNFCRIPSKADNKKCNKEKVLMWIWEHMKTMKCGIMISAVIRDARTDDQREAKILKATSPTRLLPAGLKHILEDENLFNATFVSKRVNFMTWLIIPESCAAKEHPDKLNEWLVELYRTPNPENNCKCEICGEKCKNKVGLAIHSRIHKKKFPCKICGMVCKNEAGLKSHERAHEKTNQSSSSTT